MNDTASTAVAAMTIEEQAALGSGASFWSSKAVGPIPSFILTDGPHGVRRQMDGDDALGISKSVPSTCFPPASGLGQSWDADLLKRVGTALGLEARALGVGVLLGPGVNIRRDPRCGRNFEYFSEDPVLGGSLGAAWVQGVQSEGVGTSVKHFAANNAEHDRMRSSSDVADRALREIYLRSFQRVVEDAKPWTVMCSYNKINGTYASQNSWLLTDVLRTEWGFDGVVVSDWGAVVDRVAAVAAGLDLEMPASGSDAAVVAAVEAGSLPAPVVARAAERSALLGLRVAEGAKRAAEVDVDTQHALAREAASRSIVLLKNDSGLLPLAPTGRIAVLGAFAENPRFQGGGSSHVVPTRIDVPLDQLRAAAPDAVVDYSAGFRLDGATDDALAAEAVELARAADTVVLFLGLGDRDESEGFDRDHIRLPATQLALLESVAAVTERLVVVLSHGGVVELDAVDRLATAVLDGALLGQAGGSAIADVVFGVVNPSGRLTESVPVRLQDSPAYLNFPGENSHVLYGEGIYVGYRWYDAREMRVTYPFGHGLSYTTFDYSDLRLTIEESGIRASVAVTNTGPVAGREVVQFYTALPSSAVQRPPRELKGFGTIDLEPGATGRVETLIRFTDLAYWETRVDAWKIEGGDYTVEAGASSRDIRISGTVAVAGTGPKVPFSRDSTLGEVMTDPAAAAAFGPALQAMAPSDIGDVLGMDLAKMMESFPISRLGMLSAGGTDLDALLADLNAQP